jgi:hypothetical protein
MTMLLSVGEPVPAIRASIEDGRVRWSRRRFLAALAVVLIVAVGVVAASVGGGGAGRSVSLVPASGAQIAAFLSRGEQAVRGRFKITYRVTVPQRRGRVMHALVSAAQLNGATTVYRETPPFATADPSSPARGSYEVYTDPENDSRGSYYSCSRANAPAAWSCGGPYVGIGMGTTYMLEGPNPARALLLGLQNAVAIYTSGSYLASGRPAEHPGAANREPAFFESRQVNGQEVRCLTFGDVSHPLGSGCLNHIGLIAYYDLPPDVTYGMYITATLLSYSAHIPASQFNLPVKPGSAGT